MSFSLFLGVFLCGGAGSWCRYALGKLMEHHPKYRLPLATFTVNTIGSFLLGTLTGLSAGMLSAAWGAESVAAASLLVGTGFLGGFTTFSTAILEGITRLRAKKLASAFFLLVIQPVCAFAAALAGLACATLL